MQPTDEDRKIDAYTQIIADKLPALLAIGAACERLRLRGEWHLCWALSYALAAVVEGETPPDSDAHRRATSVLNRNPRNTK